MKLRRNFFNRSADVVAKELLGKILVRKIGGKKFKGKIIEVEAYLSGNDETSKENNKSSKRFNLMWEREGTIFTYLVHNHNMLCIVTQRRGVPECVFIRALEPIGNFFRMNGPGILTKFLQIDKTFNEKNIDETNELFIEDSEGNFEIVESYRAGLKEEEPKKLRFYIKDNKFVSRK